MSRLVLFTLTVVFLASCQSKYDFWEVDHFEVVENAIPDSSVVQVIYYSGGPTDDEVEGGYYRHAIVVYGEKKDTFNVLTFPDMSLDKLSEGDNFRVFRHHPDVKAIMSSYKEDIPEDVLEKIDSSQVDPGKSHYAELDRVIRNKTFDAIADNKHKTVVGGLTER